MNPVASEKLRVILTGATGMVGEGVLHECINSEQVEKILIINRKPSGITHSKLTEIILPDFFDLTTIKEQLKGYNACFFCLGVSSVGMKESEYYPLTYTLTMYFAKTCLEQNSDMTFCYISGAGTDSSERGRMMWARVKGKTENDLMKTGFKKAYNFRPGILQPTKGLRNTLGFYKYLGYLLPVIRWLAPNSISTLKELGIAMINATVKGYATSIIEVKDIKVLSRL